MVDKLSVWSQFVGQKNPDTLSFSNNDDVLFVETPTENCMCSELPEKNNGRHAPCALNRMPK
jgi:hypothetical protein